MEKFTIVSNKFLDRNIEAYYHQNYVGYRKSGNPDFINYLKNQFDENSQYDLRSAQIELKEVLKSDLSKIKSDFKDLTVCVVPRAKNENYYSADQKLFRKTVSDVVDELGFLNGTKYIIRHENTRTTHMNNSGYGGDGEMPYVGITKDTCHISSEVRGKNILLIDDIYTKSINIDEDVIQTLLDNGARSVIFYAVGKTLFRSSQFKFTTIEQIQALIIKPDNNKK